MEKQALPLGMENFKDIRSENRYYIDKTSMIKQLINESGKVNLFTRPRRFGKTLTMSMLRYFFEIGTDKTIFDGLAISKETALCERHMGQYPVISISLKQVEGLDFQSARQGMWAIISNEAARFEFLLESTKLTILEKEQFQSLQDSSGSLENSLKSLSSLLMKYYGRKVILLIDEYDVPLDKAYQHGYYKEMVMLIRRMFGAALKTNDALQLAVLTGCLRISKESIFTGLNNLTVHTIADNTFDEWFGFTDAEVQDILGYYGLSQHYQITKEWYNGYQFGKSSVYCPWDVINWCYYLKYNPAARPQNFWVNTSGNDIIRQFAQQSDAGTREQIAELIDGKRILKKLDMNLTYAEIDENPENLWSLLYMTGYLTCANIDDFGYYELYIPNREVRSIFVEKVDKWFSDSILGDTDGLRDFIEAFCSGDTGQMQDCLLDSLQESVSYLDGGKTHELKESFYHGLLIGMLQSNKNWIVQSNREAGSGRADIIVYPRKRRLENIAFIVEVKYTQEYNGIAQKAAEALEQIESRNYDKFFYGRMPETLTCYGIAFCGKECCVLKR